MKASSSRKRSLSPGTDETYTRKRVKANLNKKPIFSTNFPEATHEHARGILQSLSEKDRHSASQKMLSFIELVKSLKYPIKDSFKTFCVLSSFELVMLHIKSFDADSALKALDWCWRPGSPIYTRIGDELFRDTAMLKMNMSELDKAQTKFLSFRTDNSWPEAMEYLDEVEAKLCTPGCAEEVVGICFFWKAEAQAMQGEIAYGKEFIKKFQHVLAPQASLWIEGLVQFSEGNLNQAAQFFTEAELEDAQDGANGLICNTIFYDKAQKLFQLFEKKRYKNCRGTIQSSSTDLHQTIGLQKILDDLKFPMHVSIVERLESQLALQDIWTEETKTANEISASEHGKATPSCASDASGPGTNQVTPTYYEILNVQINASTSEIKRSFRAKSRTAHPDRGGSSRQMAQLNHAHKTLVDSTLRKEYDLKLGPQLKPDSHNKG